MIRSAFVFALSFMALVGSARADVVMDPPSSCPTGTTPDTSHAGPHCALAPPCGAASCAAGSSCTEIAFCVRDVPCGGLRSPDEAACTERHVVGPCDAQGHCAEDQTCMRHPVCSADAPPPAAPPPAAAPAPAPAESSGGGCSAGARSDAPVLGWAIALLLLATRRRRVSRS